MDAFTIALILVGAVLLVYNFIWRRMNYFKEMGIPHDWPLPILGHMAPITFQRVHIADHLKNVCERFSDCKYFGFYNFIMPVIIVTDLDLITSIAVKNFENFTDRSTSVDGDLDPLMGNNLSALRGDRWRDMRKLLSPSFTSAKLKAMFNLVIDCADRFSEHIAEESINGKVYDMKDIFSRYTNDVIATTSFGITVDSMKNPDNEFYKFGKRTSSFSFSQTIKMLAGNNFPRLMKLLRLSIFGEETQRYFKNIVTQTVNLRKEKGINRPDMIQLMMESSSTFGRELTIEEMTCQAFVFFLAGYEAASNLLCFTAQEIAVNPDVQLRLQAEIDDVMRNTGGKPTYDAIKGMSYLDAVINEANRRYPLGLMLDRLCLKEFEIPPATPDSKPITIKPGVPVWIPIMAIHHDPKYYHEPLRFDPDRFLNGLPPPNVYMPFGLGPRSCIANRFALMETKVALFYVLLRCNLEPCAKTTHPIIYQKKSFAMIPEGGFWLNVKTRDSAARRQA
ncbi:cytochrome P450 9e2-like [Colletes gigas]|uniref:cytochrome P450 9e2-like n=1 Tax=Colletes gigas TaxID=935657 RepID=UPI001C9A3F8E|nr:cytochrome P450 9e2-like [Colletes gigas]